MPLFQKILIGHAGAFGRTLKKEFSFSSQKETCFS
jgi:hypothetical protein